jgi:SAM-dependent methyltransferase
MVSTDFDAESFDVVWNLESLCHASDADAYFQHAFHLLRDGGCFVCSDLCAGETYDAALEKVICDGWAMAALRLPKDVADSLLRQGFADIEVVDLTPRAMLCAQALEAMASRSLLRLRTEQAFLGKDSPIYEGHVRAALAMVDGMRSGRTSVTHFLARKKPRQ